MEQSPRIREIIREYNLHLCLECGKCGASCPRFRAGREFSPRMVASRLVHRPDDRAFIEAAVWECLACGLCDERCPSGVAFSRAVMELREALSAESGLFGYRAHDGAVHSWMRIMAAPLLAQNRLDWITDDLKVRGLGPVAYFVGCAPYFDVFFSNLGVDTIALAKDSIRLLNRLGIEPVVLGGERCCGHDLLWTGDQENFASLCRLNYQEFQAAGVSEVITSCPECYQVLHDHLPRAVPEARLKVTLLVDLLAEASRDGRLPMEPLAERVTYQDPCRLGRMAGRYDEPRRLLASVPGLELAEMADNRAGALCCGNSAFVNCDAFSKRIQVERLGQAAATGAGTLVTACPKCLIHTTCALRDPGREEQPELKVRGLVSLLAGQLAPEES